MLPAVQDPLHPMGSADLEARVGPDPRLEAQTQGGMHALAGHRRTAVDPSQVRALSEIRKALADGSARAARESAGVIQSEVS